MRTSDYFGERKGWFKGILRRLFYKWIIRIFLKDCKTILDIGSGIGLFYDVGVKENKDITGIDLDKRNARDNIKAMDYRNIKKHYDCFSYCLFFIIFMVLYLELLCGERRDNKTIPL